jgi:hypothetical protein
MGLRPDVPAVATLQRVTPSPGKIGDVAQAALVVVRFELKMVT